MALGLGGERNGFEVDFVPDCKILHDAGHHVLAYDLRKHGLSGAAIGDLTSSGVFEARDIVGSLTHARQPAGPSRECAAWSRRSR
jgi:alpha-beta hydrolase superfamily lysophospholipase